MKNARHLVAIMIFAAVFIPGCSKSDEGTPVEKVEVSRPEMLLIENMSQQLSVSVLPANATDKTIIWASSKPHVASVDPKSGWVLGVSPGQAVITATARNGGKTDDCVVTVIPEHSEVLDAITDPAFKAYVIHCMHNPQEGTNVNGEDITYPKWDTNGDGILSVEEAAGVTYICVSGGYDEKPVISMSGLGYFIGLTDLDCSYNKLTALDVSKNPKLKRLICDGNEIDALDVSDNYLLTVLSCGANKLGELNVSQNPAISVLYCNRNQLTELNVSQNPKLTQFDCSANQLSELNVEINTLLSTLFCSNNQLTELNVNGNHALTFFFCGGNRLTGLDLSANTALTTLQCHGNQLVDLNISTNIALSELWCYNNKLSSLDASKMAFSPGSTSRYSLYCGNQSIVGSTDLQTLILTLRTDQKPYWDSSLKNIEHNKGVNLVN